MIARRGLQYPKKGKNPLPKAKHRRTPKCSGATKPGHHHQWAPWPGRGGHHGPWWQPRSDRGEPHGRGGAYFTRLCGFPSRASSTSGGFCFVLPLSTDVSGHIEPKNSLHSNYLLIFHSFRLVLERERGSGEELRGFHTGLRSKDGNAFFG